MANRGDHAYSQRSQCCAGKLVCCASLQSLHGDLTNHPSESEVCSHSLLQRITMNCRYYICGIIWEVQTWTSVQCQDNVRIHSTVHYSFPLNHYFPIPAVHTNTVVPPPICTTTVPFSMSQLSASSCCPYYSQFPLMACQLCCCCSLRGQEL
jgi:hypothetical protein